MPKIMDSHGEKSLWIELGLLGFVVILLVCCATFTGVGRSYGRTDMMKQAVKAGVAEWVVDKDGVVQFQWIKEGDSK